MYSLFVSQEASVKSHGLFVMEKSRFLEYTDDSIRVQLPSLSNEARESICSWPCILMEEGKGQEEARLVQVTHIEVSGANLKVSISPLPKPLTFLNDDLWKMRDSLDIGDFEFSRNHWAIKERDLPLCQYE